MARKPNYSLERMERERAKTKKANAKREQRERDRAQPETGGEPTSGDGGPAGDQDQ